ncbi:MAG: exodeoxyribonuclease VII large subunit [Propionibacteriales bacterium]|nr:exodeoxyribonuclease VII large subunit [Propionibacteriales bacterium]
MALETSPESPAPLRVISQAIGGYIGKMGTVWVEGEIAQMTRRPGMSFLTLRDLEAKISISLKCTRVVMDAINPPLIEGARVVVHAKPEFYEPNGSLSLSAREIRAVGIGELLARLEQRRQLLAAEGLFDAAHKKRLPFLPHRVGLITGRNSAAEKDVEENARLRWPAVEFLTVHALMQGESSAREVIVALQKLDADDSVDVIVIARGGGAVEDLLPFSDEGLVRAVAAAKTPVVSAIGHEPDTPILDLVADLRASTPTDAAKRIVPDVREELAGVAAMRERASLAVRGFLEREMHGLAGIRTRPVLANPMTIVEGEESRLAEARGRAHRSLGNRLERAHDEIGHHLARVRALSPLSTLSRGYAVAQRPDGLVVTSIADVEPEGELAIRVTDGHILVRTVSTTAIKQETPDE